MKTGACPEKGSMSIPFTQFLRPNGRKRVETIERPAEIEAIAEQLQQAGVVFEIEELQNGVVSMEAVRPTGGDDDPEVLASELCRNGPEVPRMVDKLVKEAAASLAAQRKEA